MKMNMGVCGTCPGEKNKGWIKKKKGGRNGIMGLCFCKRGWGNDKDMSKRGEGGWSCFGSSGKALQKHDFIHVEMAEHSVRAPEVS